MTIQYQFFGYTAVYCTRRLAASPRGSRSARLNERAVGMWDAYFLDTNTRKSALLCELSRDAREC